MINYGIPKENQTYILPRHQKLYDEALAQEIASKSAELAALTPSEKQSRLGEIEASIAKPPVFTLRSLTVSEIDEIADQHAFANRQREKGAMVFEAVRREEFLKAVVKVEGFAVGDEIIDARTEKDILRVYDLLAYPDREELINVAQNSYILNRQSEKN